MRGREAWTSWSPGAGSTGRQGPACILWTTLPALLSSQLTTGVCRRLSCVGRAGLQRTGANPRASIFHPLTLFLFVLLGSPGASSTGSVTGLSALPEGTPCTVVQSGPGGEWGPVGPQSDQLLPEQEKVSDCRGRSEQPAPPDHEACGSCCRRSARVRAHRRLDGRAGTPQ